MTQPLTSREKLQNMQDLKAKAVEGGGPKRIEAQHNRGKLTARERIDLLLDPESFDEIDQLMRPRGETGAGMVTEAVVTGWGKVEGRPVFVFSYDFTLVGGSLSEAVAEKILKVMDLSITTGAPIVGIIDSGGARIYDGSESVRGIGEIFAMKTLASGVVPQLSVNIQPPAGGGAYSPAPTDFIYMTEGSGQMDIIGPDVICAATGGGSHARRTRRRCCPRIALRRRPPRQRGRGSNPGRSTAPAFVPALQQCQRPAR